jgi:2-keto-4-pentenoate hydratase/2-oxohepta-3-ene-1,7-dioic acid hydratase in catechol pathway
VANVAIAHNNCQDIFMRFVTFKHANQSHAGLLLNDRVLALAPTAKHCDEAVDVSSVLAIVRGGAASLQAVERIAKRGDDLRSFLHDLNAVQLLAPIAEPIRNVFCVGRNYVDHVKEGAHAMQADMKLPEVPQFFTKATHAVNAPQGDIRLFTHVSKRYDYEVELVLVIGKSGRDIVKERAFDHVFGYSVGNDVTARDLQRRHDQWFKGKSLDTTFPFGPSLVTRDEIADVTQLELSLTLNGELRQHATVAQMIFDIPAIIASLSAGMTLEAGDIIATGTPSGVGFAMNPPQYLKGGDVIAARISELGELRNRVVEG